jgi:hypothetical protein
MEVKAVSSDHEGALAPFATTGALTFNRSNRRHPEQHGKIWVLQYVVFL